MTKDEALKKLQAVKSYMTSGNPIWDTAEMAEAFDMAIEALSASEPERKTGRWIKWGNRYKCDQCYLINAFKKPFCPNCGARMVEDMRGERDERFEGDIY